MSAVKDAGRVLDGMRRGRNERIEEFARRLYEAQMDVYAAYAGFDFPSWEQQSHDVHLHWIQSARARTKEHAADIDTE